MPTAYLAIDIARRAIQVSQTNLQIISHNIANAGRPGYSRQRAELRPAPPLAYPSFQKGHYAQQLGTGVEVVAINRIRDVFLDHVLRAQVSHQGGYTALSEVYKNLEVLFDEPSERGLGASITDFFSAWNDLANDPELSSTRANLREKAIMLGRNFHDYDYRLKEMRIDVNTQIELKINEVNNLLAQIADINKLVMQVEGLGDKANDLRDQRDLLLDQLSDIISVNVVDEPDSSISVMLGALRIVERDTYTPLQPILEEGNRVGIRILNNIEPNYVGGTLQGLFDARDELIPEFQRKLDTLAAGIINRVNLLHLEGWGLDGVRGRPFFDDLRTATLVGTNFLPAGTTEETTLFDLGISEGYFELQGIRIEITYDEVSPDNSITLGDLFDRINNAQYSVRASITSDAIGNFMVVLDLYNPAQQDDGIKFFGGSTNFFSFTGLDTATLEYTPVNDLYSNAADKIDLFDLIETNLDVIAAALDPGDDLFPGVGENSNALLIAALQDNPIAIEGTTIQDYYSGIIASLGVQSQSYNRLVTNQEILLDQLKNQREEVSGVSLDEEAVKIIQFQRMYEGAARIISVVDGLLDTIINRMGV